MDWIVATIAVVGLIFNVRKNGICFVFWLFTNAFWIYRNIKIEEYAQAASFGIFFFVCIYGIHAWRRRMVF